MVIKLKNCITTQACWAMLCSWFVVGRRRRSTRLRWMWFRRLCRVRYLLWSRIRLRRRRWARRRAFWRCSLAGFFESVAWAFWARSCACWAAWSSSGWGVCRECFVPAPTCWRYCPSRAIWLETTFCPLIVEKND